MFQRQQRRMQREAELPRKNFQRGGRHFRIVPLVCSRQRNADCFTFQTQLLTRRTIGQVKNPEQTIVSGNLRQRRMTLRGKPADHLQSFRLQRTAHHRDAVFDDSGLFPRTRGKSRTKPFRVFQRNSGNHRELRHNNIRRIQPPAKPRLPDDKIDVLLSKQNRGNCGCNFKIGRPVPFPAHGFDNRTNRLRRALKRSIGNRLPVDAETFGKPNQVRRRIEPRRISATAQSVLKKGADGALAVAPRDMDEAETALRIAETLQKLQHPVKSEVDRKEPDRIQPFEIHRNGSPQ